MQEPTFAMRVVRVGDYDARCGASSIQKFDGEDLSIASRVLGQSEQCKAWWEAELAKKQAEKTADEAHKKDLASRVRLAPNQDSALSDKVEWYMLNGICLAQPGAGELK